MKLFTYITLAAIAVSAVSAQARHGGRRGGPIAGGPQFRPPMVRPPVGRPPVFRPPHFRPPVVRPPIVQPPIVRPPIVRPPIVQPPIYPPPILPPPIEEPVIPVVPEPGYPVPNPIPDPIEEQGVYALPPQVYIQEPCDPRQFGVAVVNSVPARSVYCSSAYIDACSQMFNGYQVYPFDLPAPGVCHVRPTYNGSWVLILDQQTILAERRSRANIEVVYRNSARMGYCR